MWLTGNPVFGMQFGIEYASDEQVLVLNRGLFYDKYLELIGL